MIPPERPVRRDLRDKLVVHSFSRSKMTKLPILMLITPQIVCVLGSMFEAYNIEPAGFVVQRREQTNFFSCSLNTGRYGHSVFRVQNDNLCEMGHIDANAIRNPIGIRVHVRSDVTVTSCVISPTIANVINGHHGVNYPSSAVLVDNLVDSDSPNSSPPHNFWLGNDPR